MLDLDEIENHRAVPLDPDAPAKKHFTSFTLPKLVARWAILFGLLGFATAISAIWTVNILLPLKEKVPYFIETDQESGQVVRSDKTAKAFTPNNKNIAFHLREWANWCETIDIRLTEEAFLPKCFQMVRGRALEGIRQQIETDEKYAEKLKNDPTYTRKFKYRSINFITKDVALLRYTLLEQGRADSKPKSTRYAMTITFAVLPEEDKSNADEFPNSFGLWVSNYSKDIDRADD